MHEDYCDLCDLPLSTCIHSMRVPPPTPPRATPTRRVTTRTPATRAGATTTRPSAARPPSRSTDQAAFRPHIVAVLLEAGGRLEQDEVLLELEIRMEEVLKERDREPSPTGEVRWQTAARSERKTMIDEGLIVGAQPGIWELTPLGRSPSV